MAGTPLWGKWGLYRVWPESQELMAPCSSGLVVAFGRGQGPLRAAGRPLGCPREPSGRRGQVAQRQLQGTATARSPRGHSRPSVTPPRSWGCVTSVYCGHRTRRHGPAGRLNPRNVFSPGPGGRQVWPARFPRGLPVDVWRPPRPRDLTWLSLCVPVP